MFRARFLIAAVVVLAACGSSRSGSRGGTPSTPAAKTRPHVTIDARDFAYTLPDSIPSGWVDVTLHNSGKVGHQIAFAKLGSVSFAAFEKAASATDLLSLIHI